MKIDRRAVAALAEQTAEKLGFELVDLEFNKEKDGFHVVVYIYSKDGVGIDECTRFSRALGEVMDREEPVEGSYFLEISSPGLDRPLKTADDFRRNLGNPVDVSLYAAVNGEKKFRGVLKDYTDEEIILETDEETVKLPISSINVMKQAIIF